MKNNNLSMQTFNNPSFGELRTIIIDGESWFIGKDVTDILKYQNGSRDINRHIDNEDKRTIKKSQISNRGKSPLLENILIK